MRRACASDREIEEVRDARIEARFERARHPRLTQAEALDKVALRRGYPDWPTFLAIVSGVADVPLSDRLAFAGLLESAVTDLLRSGSVAGLRRRVVAGDAIEPPGVPDGAAESVARLLRSPLLSRRDPIDVLMGVGAPPWAPSVPSRSAWFAMTRHGSSWRSLATEDGTTHLVVVPGRPSVAGDDLSDHVDALRHASRSWRQEARSSPPFNPLLWGFRLAGRVGGHDGFMHIAYRALGRPLV